MMLSNTQHLFLATRKIEDKKCRQCNHKIRKSELCYSKRHKHYYCFECAIKLGYIKIQNAEELFEKGQIVVTN